MTQGLSTQDLFSLEQGHVQRRLHALDTPVRAIVAPLADAHATRMLSAALQAGAQPWHHSTTENCMVQFGALACLPRQENKQLRLDTSGGGSLAKECRHGLCLFCWLKVLTAAVAGQSRARLGLGAHNEPGRSSLAQNADKARCWQEHVLPVVGPEGVWVQDSTMLHATLFHASSHKVMACCNFPRPQGILQSTSYAQRMFCGSFTDS